MDRAGADRAWREQLAELAAEHRVPGAVLGITRGGEDRIAAYGVTNVDTGVEVTGDTLFQIGSITKVFTATAVMRLVERGVLDLDKPVVSYLPELRLSDPDLTARVTMRHLLTHTSGIDGDVFTDTGFGEDALERYVATLDQVPANHPLGATLSYCNTGYSIAGRVIEKATGMVWDAAMRELLFGPLGLTRTVTMPQEALLHRTAVGHLHEGDQPFLRTPVWGITRATYPAGGVTCDIADLLSFARLHLRQGLAPARTRLLSADTVTAMRSHQATVPNPHVIPDSWGLGWFRLDWGGTRLVGHDGNTIGQSAFLRVLPEHDLAVGLLTNGGRTRDLYESLVRAVVRELTGVEMPRPLEPPDPPPRVDVAPYEGTYQRSGVRIEVRDEPGRGPRFRYAGTALVEGVERAPEDHALVPVRDGVFVMRPEGFQTWLPVTFHELPDGTPYLHTGLRATRKVEP
jgi:CubicO group peptidase (beta-lactamase class C family)